MPTISSLTIAGRRIGHDEPPYIIAELSANHGGNLERAKKIIRMAADKGADAIKFQAYTPENMTLDCDMPGFVVEADNPWKGRRLHELYASAATPYSWFPELFATARQAGITPFCSPFGADAVAMLEKLNSPAYKIASFEAVDVDLITTCAKTGKPLIISTGLCTEEEAATALETALRAGAREVALLKCSSAYPSVIEETNLMAIPYMRERFGVPVGYSDHTMGAAVAIAACAIGAYIIEKHVIDSRLPPTADSEFSALPDDLALLVHGCREAFLARGRGQLGPTEREIQSRVFRRSLYAVRDIAAGETLNRDNVHSIRPGYGLLPKYLPELIGRKAKKNIRRGEPISWDLVD
ncbi:MAG: pseudaminic acid synthase [Alphaproteobacteria bacterium]|nr:pseudaminic acid synthase [Alphaproteobacteria bacterium]